MSLAARFQDHSNPADLDEAIDILRDSLSTISPQHPARSEFLFDIGETLFIRFEQDHDERFHDLEDSIVLQREALKLQHPLHPDRPMLLLHLARDLSCYLMMKGAPLDLEEHIKICREALNLHAPLPHMLLNDFAHVLYIRFEKEDTFEDLEESIMIYRKLLQMNQTDALPDRAMTLYNLAITLSSRFRRKNDSNDLEESIILSRKALALRPASHPDRWKVLTNLGLALQTRSSHTGAGNDLEEAITMSHEVLDLQPSSHPDRFSSLNILARLLSDRFDGAGDLQDIEDSIALNREALMLQPPPHPDSVSALKDLADDLFTRFEQRGDFHDLEESILLSRKALNLQRTNHVDCSSSLVGLGCALHARFKSRGDVQDIEESISLSGEALDLIPVSQPSYARTLSNLGSAINNRFEHRGILQDLDDVIALYRRALELDPESGMYPGLFFNNLASALFRRFQQNGISGDIEESISLYREALRLRPNPHPDRYVSLVNLASALAVRSPCEGNLSDMEECITLYKEALASLPHNHPDYPWSLQGLASALAHRSQANNNAADLDESIALYERIISLEPASYPLHSSSLLNLAKILRQKFEYSGNRKDIEDAIRRCEEASKSEAGFIFPRFQASMAWASYSAEFRPTSALDAYSYALGLFPLLASVDLTLQQRQDVLSHGITLVSSAVRFAINLEQCGEAVVFLSTGRSVFWSQALQLRTSVEGLVPSHPTLAEEFLTISRQLEQASYSAHRSARDLLVHGQFNAETTMGLSNLTERRSRILEEIRQIPGFDRFLLPPSFLLLQAAADRGPLVLLNASWLGCDALILRKKSVEVVPLPSIDMGMLSVLQSLFDMACNTNTSAAEGSQDGSPSLEEQPVHDITWDPSLENPARKISRTDINSSWARVVRKATDGLGIEAVRLGRDMILANNSAIPKQTKFRFALHCLWIGVVKPIVKGLRLEKTNVPARVWWCPTGLFTSLPIHAAGAYSRDNNQPIDCLFEYAVSSYCTSPQDLLHPSPVYSDSGYKMTAVIEPEAPGSQALPGTRKELKEIEKHARQCLITHVGTKETPTQVESLLSDIQQSSIVHFGCHGMQDLDNPLESYLLLSGGKLTMSRIMKECRVPEGALAYLSACETAKGDEARPDESLNLVATMMFAGFRSVVGTIWIILDDDAPVVADVFYGHLFRNEKEVHPDIRDAAFGLHLATKELRDRGRPFESWVPYVHYGI